MKKEKRTLLKCALVLIIAVTISNYSLAQAPIADFTANLTSICYNDSSYVSFTDLSTNSPNSWNWSFPGGTPSSSTVQNPNFIWYNTFGTFDVILIVSNAFGSDTLTKTGYINFLPPIIVNLGSDILTLQPDTIVLDAGADFVSYQWSDATMNQSLNVAAFGNYCVTVTDANGCTASDCVTINEMPTLPPNANFTCECAYDTMGGSLVSFTDQSTNMPASWFWNFGDGITSAQQNQLHWFFLEGFFTITLIASNILGSDTTYGFVQINSTGGCFCYHEGNVSGKIFNDMNANCIQDFNEDGLQNRLLLAVPGPYYAMTNSVGQYSFMLDNGTYTISTMPQNYLWQQNCPVSPDYYVINISSPNDTVSNINFGLVADIYCPDLSVNISTWAVRPCLQSTYAVSYINNGTSQADNATIVVELDVNMTYSSSNGNLISQNGSILTFGIGTVNPAQSGSFYINADIACDVSLIGQTMCIKAHIYPDSLCYSADSTWDHSSISVDGICIGDSSACFTIYNTGDSGTGDMDGISEYRIFENNLLVFTGTFQINGGDSLIICWLANGNTIRLEADQRPGHPGNSHPQDNVEMCGGTIQTIGQITVIPEDDEDDFIEIDCHVVTGSYDPNDKYVFPEGLTGTYHYIDSTYIMEYTIRFQNTGTDTAFNIVIRDTLSPYLNITTIEPGTSSHTYKLDIFESNILQWKFENVLLPDSNINEPDSHGYVKYKIHQKSGNTIGTIIENKAGIIFDFNEPVMTNTVFNTIGSIDSIVSNAVIIYNDRVSVNVYPNPFNSSTTFEIEGVDKPFIFELYSIMGKQVKVISDITDKKLVISRKNLPNGIYFYKISSKNGLISAGKLIVN
ncbi:MAG: hypothetical protein COZ21_04375 [Bacteroidetes bacterium CG_4_10_14_3_um_filter_31_20]|nr:MAG: hypothetical protein COZ21_04375 [Bacteroidetes bacterium CG_4_10_14_3_um_filter_31_20]